MQKLPINMTILTQILIASWRSLIITKKLIAFAGNLFEPEDCQILLTGTLYGLNTSTFRWATKQNKTLRDNTGFLFSVGITFLSLMNTA